MATPRVLIICTWFPPVNAPGARRPYHLARSLCDRGWKVCVLTSTPEKATEPYGKSDDLHILRTPRTAATHDLNAVQRSLLRAWKATSGSPANGPLRVLTDLFLPLRPGLRWDLSPKDIENAIGPQDVVVATGPDPAVFETGARLVRHWNAVWAVDYRDPWNVAIPEVAKDIITHQGTGLAGALRRARMRKLERRYCGPADVLTAVSKTFLANAMMITGHRDGHVIHGGSVRARITRTTDPQGKFILAHTGQLYPEQPWPLFFDAITRLQQEAPDLAAQLVVRFVGATSTDLSTMHLLERAERGSGLIERMPTVTPDEAIRLQTEADALLQLALTGRKGYLPVKFLEYLGAGKPIILLSAEEDEMESALTSTRTGTIVRDARQLVAHLIAHLEAHRTGHSLKYAPDERALSAFDYATNMDRWADLLGTALRTRTDRAAQPTSAR
ncbi:MAG TPA: glycosyltransferase [Flavobacteriales bacterium]|nr:glycosyltransferase [Flavobacteriales bacterium]